MRVWSGGCGEGESEEKGQVEPLCWRIENDYWGLVMERRDVKNSHCYLPQYDFSPLFFLYWWMLTFYCKMWSIYLYLYFTNFILEYQISH